MESLAFILLALPSLMTPFLAALSIMEKAKDRPSLVGLALRLSTADLALVLVALLNRAFFLSDLNFFIADLVIGMRQILPWNCFWRK